MGNEKEVKWTPGPWAVEYKHGTTRLIANNEVIMCDETYYPWAPENDADWHLIAAAPELYDLVADAVEDACENESDWNKSARAALAKARGEGEA